jgi:hypothetical protein
MSTTELNWLPIPLDFWVPAGLKDFQQGWFINLLRASLQSEHMGYLILCEEGCSGCPACLWRVANAHHPEHFKKHSSLVLACFNRAQITGHRVLYFQKLVEKVNKQLPKIRKYRSRENGLSETSTRVHNGSGFCSPSDSFSFDFDLDSKNKEINTNVLFEEPTIVMREEQHFSSSDIEAGAQRVLAILRLPASSLRAGVAAVEAEARRTRLSMDGIVQHLTTEANHRDRLEKTSPEEFLHGFLAQDSARLVLEIVNLPITKSHISRIAAVLKAESRDTGLDLQETANRITRFATEGRQKGEKIDIFYFEDMRWRSNVRLNKAEQRKLDNLEVNARVKQKIRERLGAS